MPHKKKPRVGEKKSPQQDKFLFTGVWLTRSSPHLAYKVVPKAGCTSVGQVMNFMDCGKFFEGNVHHMSSSVMKWGCQEDRKEMKRILTEGSPVWFTIVRNPYTRLLSAFADKIFGYQNRGGRYRGGDIHKHLEKLGLTWGPKSNIVSNFRIFLNLVASTIEQRKPMGPDSHWRPQHRLLRANAKLNPQFQFHHVGHIETFRSDMETVIQKSGIHQQNLPANIPRENSTSIPAIPVSEFFGPNEVAIMRRVFAADFEFLGYSDEPRQLKPLGGIDLERLNRSLHESK